MTTTGSTAKLRFLCRRGMKETEEILQIFFDEHYEKLSPELQADFAALLDCEDPELWDWLIVKTQTEPDQLKNILAEINKD